jgi:hypothetical protein
VKSIVCWLWDDGSVRSRSFAPVHVNVLANMVERHLAEPHRFICITNLPKGEFSKKVEVMPMPAPALALLALRTPEQPHFPSCYPRLWMFSPEATCLGERVLLIDIDLVVVANLAPIFDMPQEFVGWRPYRDWGKQQRFGGGIYLLTPGTRTAVWNDFHGPESIAQARAAGFRGSDQAWISYKLGLSEAYWDRASGIYSIRDMKGTETRLPDDARLVQMNGPTKPWQSRIPWVVENWR